MDTEENPLEAWIKSKKVLSAGWDTDTVDEAYPMPKPVDEDEEAEPDWYTQRYAPQHKVGDTVEIRIGAECETHGRMKLVDGKQFYEIISGHQGIILANDSSDAQTRPYKEGHTVKVKLLIPPTIHHTQFGKSLYYGGLFLPYELIPVKKEYEKEDTWPR